LGGRDGNGRQEKEDGGRGMKGRGKKGKCFG